MFQETRANLGLFRYGVFAQDLGKETEMKSQRTGSSAKKPTYQKDLRHAIGQCLPKRGLPLQSDDQRVRWTPRLLVTAAILNAWAVASTCLEAFGIARQAVVEMYPTRRRPGKSHQGFIKALGRQPVELLAVVVASLRRCTRSLAGKRWRENGWVVMGVDGSATDCPRTKANEQAFGYSGKKKSAPQQAFVMLFHVVTGLPWAWRRGDARADEVVQFRAMLDELPIKTLLLADAYYTTYDLLRSLGERGHRFIIRVGANVSLLEKLSYVVNERRGIVYLWPKKKQAGNPPLALRLVKIRHKRQSVYLVTNVLDKSTLSNRDVGRLYRLRWGIEVMFRSLKQTMGYGKLRSESPAAARLELDWAMVGLWMLGLMTQQAMGRRPRRDWSAAEAHRAVRCAMGSLPGRRPAGGLVSSLRKARSDTYVRSGSKKSRDYPRKKKRKPPKPPKLRMATAKEILRAQAYTPLRRAG